jgi:hypothetical protein
MGSTVDREAGRASVTEIELGVFLAVGLSNNTLIQGAHLM